MERSHCRIMVRVIRFREQSACRLRSYKQTRQYRQRLKRLARFAQYRCAAAYRNASYSRDAQMETVVCAAPDATQPLQTLRPTASKIFNDFMQQNATFRSCPVSNQCRRCRLQQGLNACRQPGNAITDYAKQLSGSGGAARQSRRRKGNNGAINHSRPAGYCQHADRLSMPLLVTGVVTTLFLVTTTGPHLFSSAYRYDLIGRSGVESPETQHASAISGNCPGNYMAFASAISSHHVRSTLTAK